MPGYRIVTPKSEQLPGTTTAIYTVPASVHDAIVLAATAHNIDNSNATAITVQINTQAGGLAIYEYEVIQPDGLYLCPGLVGQGLNVSDVIQAFAGAPNDINFRLTIKENF